MHSISNHTSFKLEYNKQILVGDKLDASDSQRELVFLHGAGKAQRSRFKKLRNKLALSGVSSLAFDFIGHGDSSGTLEQDSLQSRTQQALKVIDLHTKNLNSSIEKPGLSIFATSMSAYTAIKLTEFVAVKNLILLVPAVYHHKAYRTHFNDGFSDIIRKPNNWINSDAWDLLEKFKGNLLVVTAEKDEVIPKAIPSFIVDLAISAHYKKSIEILGSSHQITHFINDNDPVLEQVAEEIERTLNVNPENNESFMGTI